MTSVDAIILAGAPAGRDLDPDGSLTGRAMVDIGGKTMLQRVVDALRGCPSISRIVAVGEVEAEGIDIVVEPGVDLIENIRCGLDRLDGAGPVLISSSDVPLLTSEAVSDFLKTALPLEVDLAYPVISRDRCESGFPGLKRTYLKTADGVFTGGNLMLARPEFLRDNWKAIADAYAARKQVFRLARMIGLQVLARCIVGQFVPSILKLAYLEAAVSRMVNARVAVVISSYPEIGEDVDKPSDLGAVREILTQTGGR